ncbi:protein PLASTID TRANSCRIPTIONALLY ACTIVE 16, chloroplastic-like [Bidens hawaiensis]|uniref:protein PLASTID TRANSCRIPTIONALLY ACTIVE 16, chloroplastic-like n=1 Tax=Bidens hawaiensis TaxID=980011 RepID=UPI004049BF42
MGFMEVTKSQIASLVAGVFSNTEVAENKVVELSTSPEATARPVSELFSAIPVDVRREAYLDAIAKAEAVKAAEAAAAKKEVEKPDPTEDFQEQAQKSFTNLVARFKTATSKITEKPESEPEPTTEDGPRPDGAPGLALSWGKLSSGFASAVKNNSIELPKVQIATVRGQAKARTLQPKPAVVKKPTAAKKVAPPVQQPKPKESKAEVRKIFGGVFQQETIYVDD